MNQYSVRTLADAMGGELIAGEESRMVESGVSTDTRTLPSGSLYFASVSYTHLTLPTIYSV